jgi:hypothetical protein
MSAVSLASGATAPGMKARSSILQSAHPWAPKTTRTVRFVARAVGGCRGQPISVSQVDNLFAQLRTQLGWINRGTHHAPRIHDLRHTFLVGRREALQASWRWRSSSSPSTSSHSGRRAREQWPATATR